MSAMVELMDAWLYKKYPGELNEYVTNNSNDMKVTVSFEFNPAEFLEAISDKDFDDFRVKLSRTREQISEQPAGKIAVIKSSELITDGPVPIKEAKTPINPTVTPGTEQKSDHPLKGIKAITSASKICPQCNNSYKPSSNAQIYCSVTCLKIAKGIDPSDSHHHSVNTEPSAKNIPAPELKLKETKPKPQVKSNAQPVKSVDSPRISTHQPKTLYIIRCKHCNSSFKSLSPSTPFCSEQCEADHKASIAAAETNSVIDSTPEPDSHYKRKVAEERQQISDQKIIDSFREHPKLDHKKVKAYDQVPTETIKF